MKLLSLSTMIIFMLSLIIMIIASTISKKSFYDREKSSPFECGFDPKGTPRLPFSIHFFLLTIIFIIFDVEITLMLPLIKSMKISYSNSWLFMMLYFFFILLIGLIYEWNYGALNWMN